ncbi:MAG TPA: 4'-phosphopantetheinyl transferase superfamily protein, partial [Bacteroidetes bacterium]|nr:4'-phosphopantetheinyl transferase superfamily protein [Bacteroidota bacterium]
AVFQSFAVRFAAKEAFKKALTAAGKNLFLNWKDVWVAHSKDDVPVLQFSNRRKNETAHWRFHVSLSHESTVAVAVVLIETKD